MSSRRWTFALCAVTLLIWTTRITNIWSDVDLSAGEKWGRTALAVSFTALALLAAYAVRRSRPWRDLAVRALAAWTVAVWVVRAVGIVTGHHDVAFVLVHLVLAAVSVTLAALAARPERAPVTAR